MALPPRMPRVAPPPPPPPPPLRVSRGAAAAAPSAGEEERVGDGCDAVRAGGDTEGSELEPPGAATAGGGDGLNRAALPLGAPAAPLERGGGGAIAAAAWASPLLVAASGATSAASEAAAAGGATAAAAAAAVAAAAAEAAATAAAVAAAAARDEGDLTVAEGNFRRTIVFTTGMRGVPLLLAVDSAESARASGCEALPPLSPLDSNPPPAAAPPSLNRPLCKRRR